MSFKNRNKERDRIVNHTVVQISPMEQYEIYSIIGQNITINNVILYFQIAFFIGIQKTIIGQGRGNQVPSTYGIVHESQYRTILQMIDTFIGRNKIIYAPMIYTQFHIILFSNQVGQVPYSSTPTVEIVMTQSLAITIQIGVQILGFQTHKLYLQGAFLPAGTPTAQIAPMIAQEVQAYQTRTQSQGQRQAVNMIAGHIQVKVIVGFIWVAYINGVSIIIQTIPLFLQTQFLGLEIQIAYQQAYIFTFIVCITFRDMTQ